MRVRVLKLAEKQFQRQRRTSPVLFAALWLEANFKEYIIFFFASVAEHVMPHILQTISGDFESRK